MQSLLNEAPAATPMTYYMHIAIANAKNASIVFRLDHIEVGP